MKVSEKDTSSLRKVLENQWSLNDTTYQFVFKNDTEGYLHEFKTYPINISGNSIKIKTWADSEEVRFYDNEVVFGDDRQSLALNSNQVYFGKGAYGVHKASQVYFGKNANELNLLESAVLAGIHQSPTKINPINNKQASLNRAIHILQRMVDEG